MKVLWPVLRVAGALRRRAHQGDMNEMKTWIIVGLLALAAFAVAPSADAAPTCQNVPGVLTACADVVASTECTSGGSCEVSYEISVSSP